MISSGLLLVAGALCLTVAVFYMGITTSSALPYKSNNVTGVLGISSSVGSGVFILSALALLLTKLSKAAQGLVSMLVLGTAIALFVGVYYTTEFLRQNSGGIQGLEAEIGQLKQQTQTPQIKSETDALSALLNFYTWGPSLGGAAGGLAILALGTKHVLKV